MEISPAETVKRPPRSLLRATLFLLPLVLAIWAQWALFAERLVLDGLLLFALAIGLFLHGVVSGQRLLAYAEATTGNTRDARFRWSFTLAPFILAVGCSALAWVYSSDNRFRAETIAFWLLATVFYLAAFWEKSPRASTGLICRLSRLTRGPLVVPWPLVGLALVMVVAAFFRFHQIAAVPAEMTSDHAEKLLDVQDVMNGEHRIFFPRNTGREPLQFYMAVPFVWIVGLSHLALKLVSATFSLATVPVVYLIGREISGVRFGLLAAGLLAISKWDVAIGRIGLRFPLYPFFTALAFYFLLRALKYGRRNDYLLCGVTTGIGLYGYSPFRAMLVIISCVLAVKVLFDLRSGLRGILPIAAGGAVLLGAIAVVMVPLARYMTEDPTMFWYRALSRVSVDQMPSSTSPIQLFLGNLREALLMFNWRGDVVWVNTIPHDPALDYVTGGLFLLGVAWAIHAVIVHHERVPAYLLVGLLASMLPSVLSLAFPGENPSVVRGGAAGVFAVLLAAVPLHLTARRLGDLWPNWRGGLAVAATIGLVFLMAGRVNYERYFVEYDRQYRQSAINTTEVSRLITGFSDSVGSAQNVYIKSWPHWLDTRSVAFNIGQPEWNNVLMTHEDLISHTPPSGNKLYILNKDDMEGARLLQHRFPGGELRRQTSEIPGREFLLFFVPDPL
jgi:hypothetical protein